jgi:formamidopyrimidine-DNA glycosylase
MPELPEVETTRRGIEQLIVGKVVAKVHVHNSSLRWPVPEELCAALPGDHVISVERRSKYLLLKFVHGTLIVHLGMTGHLRCDRVDTPLRKHDHVEIVFTDGNVLRYNDSRRFGAILWTMDDPLQHARLANLGPEPFADGFDANYMYKCSRGRKSAVKTFLMDARVVVGVGNIYASEALFRAGIAPGKASGSVSRQAYGRLVDSVRHILTDAIAAGGTTIRDFADSDGRPGYFKQELKVYGRKGEACNVCGSVIRQTTLGQRSTFSCPKCQR